MQKYFACTAIILLLLLVILRIFLLRKLGIRAMQFGKMDKKDFLIPPFALFYFYLIFAETFNFPSIGSELFPDELIRWFGAVLCITGLLLFLYTLISFGESFRVGIDEDHPGRLITTGAFAISRNPIYTAFGFILIGVFLIFSSWIFLLYTVLGFWLFNRQVLLEEKSLKKIYGEEYTEYCKKVHRYL
jgi:protein-S-isoprenylcysteine O-methyltransferase Ste14